MFLGQNFEKPSPNSIADVWERAERRHQARLRELLERDKLYGAPQRYADFMTKELERRIHDSVRIVNLEHSGAGRKRETETLAIKIVDEIGMLHTRDVLTLEQKLAAEKLQRDFWAAGLDGVKAVDYRRERVDSAAQTEEGIHAAMDAIDRYVAAIRQVPSASWPAVRDVVLRGRRIGIVRFRNIKSVKLRRLRIITLLQVGLEELARYYGFDRKKRRKHAKIQPGAKPDRADFGSSAEVENGNEKS